MLTMRTVLILQIVIFCWCVTIEAVYKPPQATVEVLQPEGLRMSIPRKFDYSVSVFIFKFYSISFTFLNLLSWDVFEIV